MGIWDGGNEEEEDMAYADFSKIEWKTSYTDVMDMDKKWDIEKVSKDRPTERQG